MSGKRLTAYIVAIYGEEMLEAIKNGFKKVFFNGSPVQYNEKFRDKRVLENTKIEILDDQDKNVGTLQEKQASELVVIPEDMADAETLNSSIIDVPAPLSSQSDISPEEEEKIYQNEIAVQRQHENQPITGNEIQQENGDNNMVNQKLEISAEENMKENEIHFNDRFREAKAILVLAAAGEDVGTIARKFRIAESRTQEIIELGTEDKVEEQLRRWYEMSPKNKKEKPVEKPVEEKSEETPVVETTPVDNETTAPGVQTGSGRIKGGVKMAEEKIVEILKATDGGMLVKDLKTKCPEGINPNTWVIRISKLKSAGTIKVDDKGIATAV